MARIIVNEGSGARSHALSGPVTVGSNPTCDVVLEHPSALGSRIELKPLKFGYRVKLIKGELLHNERRCEMADLDHNDTLRIGEVLLLYKQPEGAEGFAAAPDELPELELLEDDEDELEALSADDDDDLDLGADLELIDGVEDEDDEDAFTPPPRRRARTGGIEEIDLRALADVQEEKALEPAAPVPSPPSLPEGLDDAYLRARWKRLEVLRRLKAGLAGEGELWPELTAPGALDEVRRLDLEGGAGELEAFELEHDLQDWTLRELTELRPDALRQGPQEGAAADAVAAVPELADDLPGLVEVADEASRGQAGVEAFEELPDLSAVADDAEQAEEVEAFETHPALDRLEAEPEGEPQGAATQAAGDEPLEELEELDELEELEPEEPVPAPTGRASGRDETPAPTSAFATPEGPAGPTSEPAAASGPDRAPVSVAAGDDDLPPLGEEDLQPLDELPPFEPEDEPDLVGARSPVAGALAATHVPGAPPGARPLPPGGLTFSRPLPGGCRAPRWLPPEHPGSPPG